jgi:hypothetical protein
LLHGSRNFYHASDTWQMLLTDLKAAQEVVIARVLQEAFWKEAA